MSQTKKILGLDLGTNSIGWAVIDAVQEETGLTPIAINKAGSRIIPMDTATLGDFEAGKSVSQTKDRTKARGTRRLYERRQLRRERLNRILQTLGWLPAHYANQLNHYGQIKKGEEPKIAWTTIDGKSTFLFKEAFNEMCCEFRNEHPELFLYGKLIAYDWTIYYLRKKALKKAISGQELAWILSQANQKRGYDMARGEDDEEKKPIERKEYCKLKVIDIRNTGEQNKGRTWYEVILENGWTYRRQSEYPLDWIGKERDFIITTKINDDGTDALSKDGNVKRSISAPSEKDWNLKKIKTEHDIEQSGKTVGEFIYDSLLKNPNEKIIGNVVRVIDRRLYKEELHRIIHKQMELHPEWCGNDLLQKAIDCLYRPKNAHRDNLLKNNLEYLLIEDVLYYQRSRKKSPIGECPHEYHIYKDTSGILKRKYLKCIPKSHPVYEEFRAWQFVHNLSIYDNQTNNKTDKLRWDNQELVNWLLERHDINQRQIIEHLMGRKLKRGEQCPYRWNYAEEKTFPMGANTASLKKSIKDFNGTVSHENVIHLWHILYSVTDLKQLNHALLKYQNNYGLSEGFAKQLSKTKPYNKSSGSYSLKATQKLLTLMKCGNEWSWDAIDSNTQKRIDKLLCGEYDTNISARVREKICTFTSREQFQNLPIWLAEYVVYGVKDKEKWASPEDIDSYLHNFRIHSLNNPIVEQVVMESLRVVRDIWREQGSIDRIHLELARELKKTAEERSFLMLRQQQNESANLRARRMLIEMMNPDMGVSGVRGYSPSQLELYRLYEDDVLATNQIPDDIQKIIAGLASINTPTHDEIRKYRLWLDQKYCSPYTGETIPLARLFTPAYQIEHIIPQSRFIDDSFSNKVICEAEVNNLKGRQLAHEFISEHAGEKVTLSGGKVVTILSIDTYEKEIHKTFAGNNTKIEKLMLDEIPERFIQRQLNDSRYISRFMKSLLSNIVREIDPKTNKYETEETSKNLIVTNGSITDRLKKDWGVNDVWNHIILPRFERLNIMLQTNVFTARTINGHTIPNMPFEYRQGFSKKRIDHRHHAMDAIVIACTTRNHINLLNNESALPKDADMRYALNERLRKKGLFIKPWITFTKDVETTLQSITVSIKRNLRVINKSNNHYQRFDVNGKLVMARQTKGDNWSIRKSLHKDTYFGLVNLQIVKNAPLNYALEHINDIVDKKLRTAVRKLVIAGKNEKQITDYFTQKNELFGNINLKAIKMYFYSNETSDRYYATRSALDISFDEKLICEKITDSGIKKILLSWLKLCDNQPRKAFSPDGIEKMNINIRSLNGGVEHKPIYKVRIYEKADKFAVGELGSKKKKFVEADKGTCLFTIVYQEGSKRKLVPLKLHDVISCQKKYGFANWTDEIDKELREKGICSSEAKFLFVLSPGDLVYHPSQEEINDKKIKFDVNRIYKVVSLDGENPNFLMSSIARVIVNGQEFTKHNKTSRGLDGRLIKETCIPIVVDRLGNIVSHG